MCILGRAIGVQQTGANKGGAKKRCYTWKSFDGYTTIGATSLCVATICKERNIINTYCRVRFISLFEPLVPNNLGLGPPNQGLRTMSAGHPLFGRLITAVNMRRRHSEHLGRWAAIIMFCSEGYPRVLMCPMRCHSRDGKFLSGYVFHILFIRTSASSSLDGSFHPAFP